MKFSTQTTYGLRSMIFLAENYGMGTVSMSHLAKSLDLSSGYLERIFSKLKKGGLVLSSKGVSGGYELARSPESISAYDIIYVLEGAKAPLHCVSDRGKSYCGQDCSCRVVAVLDVLQKAVWSSLAALSLKEICSKI
jgi:Rrf2 family transcriptional regulator, cysteine metabolism repressor